MHTLLENQQDYLYWSFQYYSSQAFMPEVVPTRTLAIFGARIHKFLKLILQLLHNRSTGGF